MARSRKAVEPKPRPKPLKLTHGVDSKGNLRIVRASPRPKPKSAERVLAEQIVAELLILADGEPWLGIQFSVTDGIYSRRYDKKQLATRIERHLKGRLK